MVQQSDPKNARLISVIAATAIALACGTNYVYSAWATQFAHRLKLSSTQSNIIGTLGNLGMYACGVPFGMMVDRRGPRWGVALGSVLLGAGYYPIAKAYEAGPGVYSVAFLCIFSFSTGAGSAAAFTGAMKTAALNYPESRGTATAFPLAAFGLSAFFFSSLSAIVLRDDTYVFLLVLATGTVVLPVASFFFLRVIPPSQEIPLVAAERQPLNRGTSTDINPQSSMEVRRTPREASKTPDQSDGELSDGSEESSFLISRPTSSDIPLPRIDRNHEDPALDIRGLALLPHPEFWQLFCMLGLLTGIGLMTINNIGNVTEALWMHYDPSASDSFIQKRQVMHVSILSLCSFSGRLLSGSGSDVLVKKLQASRFWCLVASAVLFTFAQIFAITTQNPHFLGFVSGLTGLAYGMLFGVYPTLVAHTFGVGGLAQNWGTMTLAPVIAGNIFNLLYGAIFDSHSIISPDGDPECHLGKSCYSTAYWVTFGASIFGIALSLWSIWHENQAYKFNEKVKRRADHGRDA